VARALCDVDEVTLLRLLAPRAVPRLVLVGGLASAAQGSDEVGVLLGQLSGVQHVAALDEYVTLAGRALGALATALQLPPRALLVEHMHLVLAEVFTRAAASDSGELSSSVVEGALAFLFDQGIPAAETIASTPS
jgi:hypothetical protein